MAAAYSSARINRTGVRDSVLPPWGGSSLFCVLLLYVLLGFPATGQNPAAFITSRIEDEIY
jgi:hypothetical protein